MASKKLQGITIEIDGNTTGLSNALKGVNKDLYNVQSELNQVNKLLKLDPSNTELLSQKQKLLSDAINSTSDKLKTLKQAKEEADKKFASGEMGESQFRELEREIVSTEQKLNQLNNQFKETKNLNFSNLTKSFGEISKKIGEVAAEVIQKVASVVAAVGGMIAGVVAAGIKSYAELEQNLGGVDTLFKDSADKVIANASKAYETAGISANEYMTTVTSFSASLLQSLSGDTSKAADIADMALIDMADNANKFGTDMQAIQNAYQGFAKQNYTMLDNLKLGYGGTKTEMERLLKDAEKISGIKYDISNLSDVYSAIHVIQEELGVAGTTALEASTTISGSMSSMKAAFDNFLNGTGSPEQLAQAVTTFISNISDVILKLAPSILSGLAILIKDLLPKIGTLLIEMLPQLFTAAQDLISSLLSMIQENVQPLADTVVSLVMSLVNFILENLPTIIEAGLQIIIALATGIAENIDELIPSIISTILKIVEILLENLDLVIEAAFKLILGIASGIVKAIPQIVSTIPSLITKIISALVKSLESFLDVGVQLVKGIWEGISKSYSWIKDKIKGWVGNVLSFIKKLFGIHSPSKVMEQQVGENLGLGIASGIDNTVTDVEEAMKGLRNKVEASVNPVINPTANSNPLIIQIENFNNSRGTDIQALAEELEFYRKNSALAKGGN